MFSLFSAGGGSQPGAAPSYQEIGGKRGGDHEDPERANGDEQDSEEEPGGREQEIRGERVCDF